MKPETANLGPDDLLYLINIFSLSIQSEENSKVLQSMKTVLGLLKSILKAKSAEVKGEIMLPSEVVS